MNPIVPMNDYLLVRVDDEKKTNGVYFGENKSKPKSGTILAFSKECKNKNLEVDKKVLINKYEMIPFDESNTDFFVSEKAIIAMM